MAKREHLAKILEGVAAWNDWRNTNSEIIPDLSSENLSEARFRGAKLSQAFLFEVDLNGANLIGTNLTKADLTGAVLCRADLSGANLNAACLLRADLGGANLTQADLTGALIGYTTFGDNDLSQVTGLDTVRHLGPSTIGIDTIYRSKGKIPEAFLRGAGVPDNFIEYMHSLTGAALEFYSCFISHSTKDKEFADRVHEHLQNKGVRCWFAPQDLKIGDRFQEEIERSIRVYEKLLIILSDNSVNSPWVEREVQAAMEKEHRSPGDTVLFPIRLDDAVMDSTKAWAADIRRTRHIGDFRNWKDHDASKSAFERLLRDLKTKETKAA